MDRLRCSRCQGYEVRANHNEERDTQGKLVFRNQAGKRWNGYICPLCLYQTRSRFKKKRKTVRKCQKVNLLTGKECGKTLPASRYFHCLRCVRPDDHTDDKYTIYEGTGKSVYTQITVGSMTRMSTRKCD